MSTTDPRPACHFCGTADAPMSSPHYTDRDHCIRVNVCDSQECRTRLQYNRPRKNVGYQGRRPTPQRPTMGTGDVAGWSAAARLSRRTR